MRKALFAVCLSCLLTHLAVAQTKMSGTIKCGKSSIKHMVPVGDHPNHFLGVKQVSCTWSKPWMIAGIASKEGVGTSTLEAEGELANTRGLYVDTMANGDKAHYLVESSVTTKDGHVQVTGHKWQLVEGTGKLKGAKGQGTCTGSGTTDRGVTYECEGEYTLPQ
jgi:hypothetical protein